jgi:hypothetical protein
VFSSLATSGAVPLPQRIQLKLSTCDFIPSALYKSPVAYSETGWFKQQKLCHSSEGQTSRCGQGWFLLRSCGEVVPSSPPSGGVLATFAVPGLVDESSDLSSPLYEDQEHGSKPVLITSSSLNLQYLRQPGFQIRSHSEVPGFCGGTVLPVTVTTFLLLSRDLVSVLITSVDLLVKPQ